MSDGASNSDHGYNPGRKTAAQSRRDAYWAKMASKKSATTPPKQPKTQPKKKKETSWEDFEANLPF